MSYSEQIFGKQLHDITYQDIELFFSTEQEETTIIEFKSGEVELDSVFKGICAFLNTQGGLMIIGSPKPIKPTESNDRKICKGTPILTKKLNSREQLQQKIASFISPLPVGLKIHQIPMNDGSLFLIEVPQSDFAPHQCLSDGKYYMRLDVESRFAPHGFVEALFNRRQKPLLVADVVSEKIDEVFDEIEIVIENNSATTAEDVEFIVKVFGVEIIERESYDRKNKEGACTDLVRENGMLVKGLKLRSIYRVKNWGKKYHIHLMYWCKNSKLFECEWEIRPENNSFATLYDSNTHQETERGKIEDLLSPISEQIEHRNNKRVGIQPEGASFCRKFISEHRQEIIAGEYTVVVNKKWINDLSIEEINFLSKYCIESREIIGENVKDLSVLESLSNDKDLGVQISISRNKNISLKLIEKLAKADSLVRTGIAENENTPIKILEILARDSSGSVRAAVAKNKNSSMEILKVLRYDQYLHISEAAYKNSLLSNKKTV